MSNTESGDYRLSPDERSAASESVTPDCTMCGEPTGDFTLSGLGEDARLCRADLGDKLVELADQHRVVTLRMIGSDYVCVERGR